MSLLSNPDPSDANNPLKQIETSVQGVHPGFFRSLGLGFSSGINDFGLGVGRVEKAIGLDGVPFGGLYNPIRQAEKEPLLTQKEELANLQNKKDTFDEIKANEKGFSAGAGNFLGNALNPAFLAAGAATGGAADVGLGLLSQLPKAVLPSITSKIADQALIQGITRIAPKAIEGGAFLGGGSLPQTVADNYNENTKSIKWGGVVKSSGINFGMGMALVPLHPVLGAIIKKLKLRGFVDKINPKVDNKVVNEAEKQNVLTDNEQEFLKSYNEKQPTEKLNTLAQQVMRDNDPNALDKDGKVQVPLATINQLHNINDNGLSEMANDFQRDDKTPLSDSIIHSQLGETINDPIINDGLEGLIFHFDNQEKNFDDVLKSTLQDVSRETRDLPEDIKAVSQSTIFKMALKNEYPGFLPDNVLEKVRLSQKIDKLRQELTNKIPSISTEDSLRQKTADSIRNDIKSTKKEADNIKLLSHSQELTKIEDDLFPKGELLPDYQVSPDFLRLREMIREGTKSKAARLLAAKIQLTGDINEQRGFRTIANELKKASDNPNINFDKSQNAIEYTRNNILNKQAVKLEKPVAEVEKEALEKAKNVPTEEIEPIEGFVSPESKVLLESANKTIRQSNEMKANKSIFDELNNCMQGKL